MLQAQLGRGSVVPVQRMIESLGRSLYQIQIMLLLFVDLGLSSSPRFSGAPEPLSYTRMYARRTGGSMVLSCSSSLVRLMRYVFVDIVLKERRNGRSPQLRRSGHRHVIANKHDGRRRG